MALPSPPASVVPDMFYHPHMNPVITSATRILSQPPPPTLREILSAYKMNGDGDRDMLLALLHAKTAEDQRLAETASLHARMLDAYAATPAATALAPPSPLTPLHCPVSPPFSASSRTLPPLAPTSYIRAEPSRKRSRSPSPRMHPYAHVPARRAPSPFDLLRSGAPRSDASSVAEDRRRERRPALA